MPDRKRLFLRFAGRSDRREWHFRSRCDVRRRLATLRESLLTLDSVFEAALPPSSGTTPTRNAPVQSGEFSVVFLFSFIPFVPSFFSFYFISLSVSFVFYILALLRRHLFPLSPVTLRCMNLRRIASSGFSSVVKLNEMSRRVSCRSAATRMGRSRRGSRREYRQD